MIVVGKSQPILANRLFDHLQQFLRCLLAIIHDLAVDPRTPLAVGHVHQFFEKQMEVPRNNACNRLFPEGAVIDVDLPLG